MVAWIKRTLSPSSPWSRVPPSATHMASAIQEPYTRWCKGHTLLPRPSRLRDADGACRCCPAPSQTKAHVIEYSVVCTVGVKKDRTYTRLRSPPPSASPGTELTQLYHLTNSHARRTTCHTTHSAWCEPQVVRGVWPLLRLWPYPTTPSPPPQPGHTPLACRGSRRPGGGGGGGLAARGW